MHNYSWHSAATAYNYIRYSNSSKTAEHIYCNFGKEHDNVSVWSTVLSIKEWSASPDINVFTTCSQAC
jgi:hypothetical protein